MKKILYLVIVLLIISIVACQQVPKKDFKDVMKKKEVTIEMPATTGDAAVDAVGNDLNNIGTVDKDLSADELADLDSGLQDVQNI